MDFDLRAPADVLYVHPRGHMNELVVPTGAITCMNAISASKLGRYAFEVSADEIQAARVIAIDLHWALALAGFEPLVRHIRRLVPDVPIVVGGITAGHYARELLESCAIDYVIQGDAERAFPELVASVLRGTRPAALANVHARGSPAPTIERVAANVFDQGDCLRADWFPTYEKWANADAAAFPQGRVIGVTRGCALRCPECYGSYARTFGPGQLNRSAQRVANLVERAAAEGHRHLRLILGKPGPQRLSELIDALGACGPHHFSSAIGLYCCTPPSERDLARLESAFSGEIALSFVPPSEHQPQLPEEHVEREQAQWRTVSGHVAKSAKLRLDAWVTSASSLELTRSMLGESARTSVSYGATWSSTRPTDERKTPFEELARAVRPLWTFYAARLLLPALGELVRPFALLDEIDPSVDRLEACSAALDGFRTELISNWRAHRLPTIPGLSLSALSLRQPKPLRLRAGPRLHDDLGLWEYMPQTFGELAPLAITEDHRGVDLRAELDSSAAPGVLALIANPIPRAPVDEPWVRQMARPGLVGLRVPAWRGRASLRIHLRVQQAQVALLDSNGELLAGGTADLDYYPRPRARLPLRSD